jgi:hypothetical protein
MTNNKVIPSLQLLPRAFQKPDKMKTLSQHDIVIKVTKYNHNYNPQNYVYNVETIIQKKATTAEMTSSQREC